MTIRATPLLVAPDDSGDSMLGQPMTSHNLITGLRRCNNNLVVPDAQDRYRTQMFKGITALWLGPPGQKSGRKICAFHLGQVPEWTLVDEGGMMITRGWRAVFWKVLKAGACRQADIEREFGVNLDYVTDTTLCKDCVREGDREPNNGGVMNRCNFHDNLHSGIKQGKKDAPELKNKSEWEQTKAIFA